MAGKQRQITGQFKLKTGMEVLRGEKAMAQMCRERSVTDWLVYKWRSEFLDKAPGMFEGKLSNASSARIAELERLVGQLSMANAL